SAAGGSVGVFCRSAKSMFSIGEFSKLTGLTVKTLRFYHEEGLLIPAFVDPDTSYRYYNESQIETARVIAYLRSLEFPLADIKQLPADKDEPGLLDRLERQRSQIKEQIKRLQRTVRSLEEFITAERQGQAMTETLEGVTEKNVDALLVAGIRMKGRYN